MPSIKDLKKRITTVKNTQQTTKAMKMVSAAKLRRAQDAILNQRPYARKLGVLILQVSAGIDDEMGSPLITGRKPVEGAKLRALLTVVSSDRGLCGGFNGNIIKAAQRWINENSAKYASIQVCFVGKKAYEVLRNRKGVSSAKYTEFGGKVGFAKALELAAWLVEQFLSEQTDEVFLLYNEFKNAITQKVVVEPFLPLNRAVEGIASVSAGGPEINPDQFVFKPSRKELLESLLKKHFGVQILRILLESQASEHGARMAAMENATKNAGEMIRKLTLLYNKQRQAGITKELLEIISGSESQKAG